MKQVSLTAAVALVCACMMPVPVAGQSTEDGWEVPRTADGRPDLRGVWSNNTATPLQRPAALGDKAVLTDEELAEVNEKISELWEREQAGDLLGDTLILKALDDSFDPAFDRETGNYNSFWLVATTLSDNRTSLIVDPPNGRIPPFTAEAQQRAAERRAYGRDHPADSWQDRSMGDRCIASGGPWLVPGYNSYFQIFQTPNQVGILQEYQHQARLIPLDGRAALDGDIRQWSGAYRGRWEGDTLVVEGTNFAPQASYQGASGNLRLVERFTRISEDTLRQEITLDDPTTWAQPWTLVLRLKSTEEPLYEYACHEGNHSMEGILAGHRAEERAGTNEH